MTLADQKRWQVGDRKYGVIHRGRTYLFAGPVEQQKFLSNPDHYSPAISGQDVVMALDQGQTVDGRRQFGLQYQGRTYLFSSDASRKAFSQNPKRYAAEVLQAENPNRPPLR
jgi:protein disulfide-isomerase